MKLNLLLATSLLAAIGTSAVAQDIFVERVRYCTSPAIQNACNNSRINPKFSDWVRNGTSIQEQKETYISIINEPERSKVKRVVFISAGQQLNKGFPNALTGQPKKYKDNCTDRIPSCTVSTNPMSLMNRLRNSGEFEEDETLYISVLDAKFGYFRPFDEKQRIENAYWDFLTSKYDPENVELIVLAGQSRAGCLVYRLGQRLRQTEAHKDIPLIIQGHDPVCMTPVLPEDGLEFPPGRVEIAPGQYLPPAFNAADNPLDSSKKAYLINMGKVFPSSQRENLKILNIQGGGKVGYLDKIRASTWKSKDVDLGWWKQKWVNYEHNDMGGYLENGKVDPVRARQEMGDVAYEHIFNYVKYELGRPDPTNFKTAPSYPVDINGDRKSDIVLAYRDPTKGLRLRTKISDGNGGFTHKEFTAGDGVGTRNWGIYSGYFNRDSKSDILVPYQHKTQGLLLRTKMSNGDGTYQSKSFASGDGPNLSDMPLMIGDVDGDGLSDVILRYQHPSDGLIIRTKMSKGDGTFEAHNYVAGDGDLGDTLRAHVGDVNGDRKTDLIYLYQRSIDKKMEIRTRTSNGDGTFNFKKSVPLHWTPWSNIQSFVTDVNRDRKTDLVVLERASDGKLSAHTFMFKADGTFDRVIDVFTDGPEVDEMETIVADVNGDQRSDIVMRVRDKTGGLKFRIKQSLGNGRYSASEYASGDGSSVDQFRILTGNYDAGRRTDLALRYRHASDGLIIRTKMGTPTSGFSAKEYKAGDGATFDAEEALSGPVFWNGGGTFNPPRTDVGQIISSKKSAIKARENIIKKLPKSE